jgi:hypothetical protein
MARKNKQVNKIIEAIENNKAGPRVWSAEEARDVQA